MLCSNGDLECFEAAVLEFSVLIQEDTDGVRSNEDISWAVSGRFVIYSSENNEIYVEETDGVDITVEDSTVDILVDDDKMENLSWQFAQWRLELLDAAGAKRVRGYGKIENKSYVDT